MLGGEYGGTRDVGPATGQSQPGVDQGRAPMKAYIGRGMMAERGRLKEEGRGGLEG